jgi:hypothetical protein
MGIEPISLHFTNVFLFLLLKVEPEALFPLYLHVFLLSTLLFFFVSPFLQQNQIKTKLNLRSYKQRKQTTSLLRFESVWWWPVVTGFEGLGICLVVEAYG